LREAGVSEGDRVAAILPNMAEAIVSVLATASIGAVCRPARPTSARKASSIASASA
jgi:acetoacetyl-CoA synthetase